MFNVCSLQEEWRFLLSGGTSIPKELINPAPKWLSERAWKEILSLAALVSKTFSFMTNYYFLIIFGFSGGFVPYLTLKLPLLSSLYCVLG